MRSSLFKFIHTIGFTRFLRLSKSNNLTILSIHRISDEKDYFFNPITPKSFELLLQYIIKHYNVISFFDTFNLPQSVSKPFLILSFDDGYYDFYEFALPLLKKYNLPCNHNIVNMCANTNRVIWTQRLNFIFDHCRMNNLNLFFEINSIKITLKDFENNWMNFYLHVFKLLLFLPKFERIKLIEEKECELALEPKYRMMNWEEIIECSKNGVEIGSHTYTHDVLSTINDDNVLIDEIINSKKEIEEKIQKKVNIIALPNGQGNKLIDGFCKNAGFDFLLYVNDGINSLSEIKQTPLNKLNRISLVQENHFEMALRIELFHSKLKKYV